MREFTAHAGTKPATHDEQEFTRLYRESYGLVYNYVRHRIASDEAPEHLLAVQGGEDAAGEDA